ncbi:MAG TPA: hypothetical protein VM260_12755, partial [Pirellula sp.]|nr:hypothetical protein [Pirellula sp.]
LRTTNVVFGKEADFSEGRRAPQGKNSWFARYFLAFINFCSAETHFAWDFRCKLLLATTAVLH